MDTFEMRYRIVSVLNKLISVSPQKRVEMLDVDTEFCEALEVQEIAKSRNELAKEAIMNLCATLV